MICAICPSDLPPSPPPAPRRIRAQRAQNERGTHRVPRLRCRSAHSLPPEGSLSITPRALPLLPQQGSILSSPRPPHTLPLPPISPQTSTFCTPWERTAASGARRGPATTCPGPRQSAARSAPARPPGGGSSRTFIIIN